MGRIETGLGDLAAARRHFSRGMEIFLEYGPKTGIAWILQGMAVLAAAEGEPLRAARRAGAAAALRVVLDAPLPKSEALLLQRRLAPARAALGEMRYEEEWRAGGAAPLEDAIADVLTGESKA